MNIILTNKSREALGQAMPVAKGIMNQAMLSIIEGGTRLETGYVFLSKIIAVSLYR